MGKRVLRGTDTAGHRPLGGATRTTTDWEGLDALVQGPAPLLPWPLFGRTPARVQPGGRLQKVFGWKEGKKFLNCRLPGPLILYSFNVAILYDILKTLNKKFE